MNGDLLTSTPPSLPRSEPMHNAVLPIHAGLADSSRLPVLSRDAEGLRAAEILLLLGVGVVAAAGSAFLDLGLRIPGHAILRAVFPMAFGLALVPRQFAGTVMGIGALASAGAIKAGGSAPLGLGAMTSLTLTGPLLDLALWRVQRGWPLYLGFALAGLGSNLAAMGVRGGARLMGWDPTGGRPLALWWPQAIVTYALCGIVAGLISAVVWFRFSESRRPTAGTEARE